MAVYNKKFKKDLRRRFDFQFLENVFIVVRFLKYTKGFSNFVISNVIHACTAQDKYIQKSKFKNFCIISGRARSIVRKLKVSRIVFKFLVSSGFAAGYSNAS
jgi:ribosomal protein S14